MRGHMQPHADRQPAIATAPGRPTDLVSRLRGGAIAGAIAGLCCALVTACGIGGSVGGGSVSPEISFRVQGTNNTPFTALITDTTASWTVNGVTPVAIVILNVNPSVRVYASELKGNSAILTVQTVSGGQDDLTLVSTDAPFGTVVTQTGRLDQIAPPADPDARFFVKGSKGEAFNGLIQDLNNGFALNDFVRTIFLFENPSGKVDGFFSLTSTDEGPLLVDLAIGGSVVANASGNPTVHIRAP